MKRLGIIVLCLSFFVSVIWAGGNPFKKIEISTTQSFKSHMESEVDKEKK